MATQPVFHMDVTKVVSADSYASELLNHFIPQNVDARTDPNGESDFLQLVALSTNNVLLQYRPAKAQRGALSAMCSAISTGTRSLKDPMPPPLNSPGTVTQDALDVVDAYARFESTNKQRLIEWVQFQTWDEDIQKVFWDTNRLQELGDALEVYRAGSAGTAIFEHALIDDRMLTFAPDEVQRAFTASDFYVAYAFWSYIKGYRFARQMHSSGVYADHWLRHDVVTKTANQPLGEFEQAHRLVPWASLLQRRLQTVSKRDSTVDALISALKEIRKLTVTPRDHEADLESPAHRRNLLVRGIQTFDRVMGISRSARASRIVQALENLARGSEPFLNAGGVLLEAFRRPIANRISQAETEIEVQVLASINHSVASFIEHGVANERAGQSFLRSRSP